MSCCLFCVIFCADFSAAADGHNATADLITSLAESDSESPQGVEMLSGWNKDDADYFWSGNKTEPLMLGTDGADVDDLPLNYRILATVLHSLIFCFGVTGNIMLIYVAHKARSLQTPTYSYLVSI